MRKISILIIAFIIFGLLILLGCSKQDASNLKMTAPSQENKLENNEKVSDVDWKPQYKVINKLKYYVLINEYLDNNDKYNPNISILVREYWCFDGTGEWSQDYPFTNKIALPKSNEINSTLDYKNKMKKLDSKANSLRLRENTIVSDAVLNQWNEENYDTKFEYSKESPKGLTYEMLKKSTW
jgi:hypothetical protein